MKIKRIICGFLLMLLCATPTIVATPSIPAIRLPTELVTMNVVYGNNSYFDMYLSDIPLGYDITNGLYHGWCVQQNIRMTQHVNHTVLLYSSTDPELPTDYQNIHWDYINYLLNHKQGNQSNIQQAIWYFTSDKDCSSDADAYAMIIDAELHGEGFIPTPGQLIAIPIIGIPGIQLTFLEATILIPQAVEGLVWKDSNHNGLQDSGEPGINTIQVDLYQQDNQLINTTMTTSKGTYNFTDLTTNAYYIKIRLPTGYHFSPQNKGTNEAIDSDVDTTGRTPVFMITLNQTSQRWDAGMYTTTSHPITGVKNHRPTADGTAGEPYNGFVHETITFDGSRSYDRDGTIISWLWSFGDGTTATGAITTHTYNNAGDYPVSLIVTDNNYESDTYTTTAHIIQGNNPPTTPQIIGPTTGHVNTSYDYLLIATDPDNNTLRYIIDWDDNHTDTSPFFASGHPISLTHQWDTRGFFRVRCCAQDQNNATSQFSELILAIDVQYVGPYGYLIDTDSDGIFDLFHSNSTQRETKVKILENGDYLIDTDGDGDWDIVYNPNTHQYQKYVELPLLEYILLVLLIISFLLIVYLIRIKRQTRTLSNIRKNKQ